MTVIDFHSWLHHRSDHNPFATVQIGQQLKRAYDEMANEPVPDRFTELLRQLETAEASATRPKAHRGTG